MIAKSDDMTANFDLKYLLSNPPPLHERQGKLISDWRIDDRTCLELSKRLKPGMKTLETGGGLSTIIFAASGCHHTCIMPDADVATRIISYCYAAGISVDRLSFVSLRSCDHIHQVGDSVYDVVLIDGCHGFPTAFVDFYYAAKALKMDDALVLDDMHIFTCDLIARFMKSDPGWNVELMTTRFIIGRKAADTIDREWNGQQFVLKRSKDTSVMKHPLFFAKIVRNTLQDKGIQETARKIAQRFLG